MQAEVSQIGEDLILASLPCPALRYGGGQPLKFHTIPIYIAKCENVIVFNEPFVMIPIQFKYLVSFFAMYVFPRAGSPTMMMAHGAIATFAMLAN